MASLFSRKNPYEIPTYQSMVASTEFKPQTGSSLFASKTPNYSQGLFTPASRQPQNTINTNLMSKAPIQGSGYSSNYASNPTNYKAPVATPVPKYKLPTQPQVNPMAQYTKNIDDYFKKMSDQSAQRVSQEEQARQKQQDFLNQRYGLMNEQVRGSIPILKSNFDTFKGNTQAGVADVVAKGEAQKEQARDYFGEATRTAAQARGETQQQATQKFASQGAIDSAGAGSYRQANENIDSDFNAYVQKNSKELAYKLTDIDSAVGEYQRQATTLIQNEEAKLQESLRQIEFTLADNEIAKNQAIEQVYQQYQDRINSIQDTLSAIEQQAIEQKNNIGLELEKLSKTTLSPEFMATGVPTTQAEYEFMVTNADKMKELGIIPDSNQSNSNQNKALTMVNNILSGDTKGITGAFRTGQIPVISNLAGTVGQQTDYDGLKSLLALAERGQLKGSGTVSDFEAKMLEKAAMAGLNQNLPDDEFRRRLQILQQDLMSGGATANNMSSNIITAPDGQQVMIVD
jgi:polyhydroxyalkanoate synthesis regulator phasin